MANTFAGMSHTNIAQRGFTIFLKKLVRIVGTFSTDFSSDVAEQGTVVQTRTIPARTAQDLVSDHSGNYNTAADVDITTSAVSVTLDNHLTDGFYSTDKERAAVARGVWQDTIERNLLVSANAVAVGFHDMVINKIVAASFASSFDAIASANVDSDTLAAWRGVLVKADFDPDETNLFLHTDIITALHQDNAIQDFSASQDNVQSSGNLNPKEGMGIFEDARLPPAAGAAAGENLTGFAATPDAMMVAMRATTTQGQRHFDAYIPMTDDKTGATLLYTSWFDTETRKQRHLFECLCGAAKGNGAALYRVKSA